MTRSMWYSANQLRRMQCLPHYSEREMQRRVKQLSKKRVKNILHACNKIEKVSGTRPNTVGVTRDTYESCIKQVEKDLNNVGLRVEVYD